MSAERCTWRGRNRGCGYSGREVIPDVVAFVQHKYLQGWTRLEVTRDGVLVGEIGPHPSNTRARTWWGEAT